MSSIKKFHPMLSSGEQLKRLFQAFRDHDSTMFFMVAESLIAEETAANHHALARDLKKALGDIKDYARPANGSNGFKLLPKDRRSGEELIALQESSVDETKIVLAKETNVKIDRILTEHRQRRELAKYGYAPKTKLLFWGAPGCGKTFTAHYLAYELGLPVGVVQLNALISSFLGDTASNLQRVFQLASNTPMVLLLDEIDAVGKNRDDQNDVGELKRIVNSLLQAMDFFTSKDSIIIAASNHQYLLDPAMWRRFDDIVHFPSPGQKERERYIQSLLNGVGFDGSITNLAKSMTTASYADIQRIVVEGVKTMILEGRHKLLSKDITEQIRAYKNALMAAQSAPEKFNE